MASIDMAHAGIWSAVGGDFVKGSPVDDRRRPVDWEFEAPVDEEMADIDEWQVDETEDVREPQFTAQWLAEDEGGIGPQFALNPPQPEALEYPGETGAAAWTFRPLPVMLPDDPPPGAFELMLLIDGNQIGKVRAPQMVPHTGYASLPEYQNDRLGSNAPGFTLHIFAERFADQAAFVEKVEELWDAICNSRPFDDDMVVRHLALEWHFAPSDVAIGHFDTRDAKAQIENGEGRLFLGDQSKAEEMTRSISGEQTRSVILINSTIGGGAGGSSQIWQGQTLYYPSWASIKSRANEFWWQVCIHELGHGLGLGDEYSAAYPEEGFNPLDPEIDLEHNIARTEDLADVIWCDHVTVPVEHFGDWQTNPAVTEEMREVAAYEGARYSSQDLFRPSAKCRMNGTRDHFCPVCCDLISRRLRAP